LTDKKAQNRNELSYLINLFKLLIHRLQILWNNKNLKFKN
jgi:hypothetical protein